MNIITIIINSFKTLKREVQNFIKKSKSNFGFKQLFFVSIILYLIPKKIFEKPNVGLDPSWMLSINMAIKENLIWGKEIILTYGPLGYVSTKIPDYTSALLIVLFYILIVSNAIYFIHYLFKAISSTKELVFATIVFIFFGNILFLADSVSLYFYFIFHLFHFIKHRNFSSIILISIFSLLAFYIKVNTGLVINILMIISVIYLFLSKTLVKKSSIFLLIIHFSTLFGLSYILNTDLRSYIFNSLTIINSYNDAMVVISENNTPLLCVIIIIFAISIPLIFSIKSIFSSIKELFLFFNISLFSYILFKQSFVRADYHTDTFFSGIIFIVFLVFTFTNVTKIKHHFFYTFIVVSIFSVSALKKSLGGIISANFANNVLVNAKKDMNEKLKKRELPKNIMSKIRNKTVDILGYETSFIFYNKLKYNPRPIIQSYYAYHTNLIALNRKKYESKTSADFILYHFGSIDNRHPFWDEPQIYLPLLANYSIDDSILYENPPKKVVLFKKNPLNKVITEKVLMDTVIHLNSRLEIPQSKNIIYLTVEFDYTNLGKLRRLLYQPSLANIKIYNENNDSTQNTLIFPIMKSGVPINKIVLNSEDAMTFFKSFGKGNRNAKAIKIQGNPIWIDKSFKVKLVEYGFK